MSAKGRVMVAMSGGVDSSIAAFILKEQGYEVLGATLRVWDCHSPADTDSCNIDSINDARSVAAKMNFQHSVIDVRKEFENIVVSDFVGEYLAGRTPNPCVLCNPRIKWNAMLQHADSMQCEYIATGHYVKLRQENNRFVISKGQDESKDQSYVLYGLPQSSLSRTIFPLGDFSKTEIKKMARACGFSSIADKRESFDVCFIPDNDYRGFLNRKVEGLEQKYAGGDFVSTDGKVLGKHKGYPFYTVGQRKGLEIAVGHPLYVAEIRPETNTIVLGTKEAFMRRSISVRDFNLVKYDSLAGSFKVVTKVRYKDKGSAATITQKADKIEVTFAEEVSAVAPGQSAVFYENDDVVGGGIIE